jgi:hypothetical protein
MTAIRRRVLRPPVTAPPIDPRRLARRQRQQEQLAKDQVALKRWLSRLKRAVTTLGKLHQRITKLANSLAQAE